MTKTSELCEAQETRNSKSLIWQKGTVYLFAVSDLASPKMVEKALEERLRCIMKTFAEKTWGDCSKAVAYQFNFVKLVYRYSADC